MIKWNSFECPYVKIFMIPNFPEISHWNFLPLTLNCISLGIDVVIKDFPRSCGGTHRRTKFVQCSGLPTFLCGMTVFTSFVMFLQFYEILIFYKMTQTISIRAPNHLSHHAHIHMVSTNTTTWNFTEVGKNDLPRWAWQPPQGQKVMLIWPFSRQLDACLGKSKNKKNMDMPDEPI